MLKVILKFSCSLCIIIWLLRSGELDFSLSRLFLKDYKSTIIIFILSYLIITLLISFRWKILLQSGEQKNLSFKNIFKISWIGLFFNSVLPGAVTGDLIKLAYVKDLGKNITKTFMLSTVFIDRIIGLLGLICLSGVFSLYNYAEIVSISPSIKSLVHLNFLLFIGAIIFILTLFLSKNWQKTILYPVGSIPILGKKIKGLLEEVWLIGNRKDLFFKCLFISIIVQVISVCLFWKIITPFTSVPLSIGHAFIFIPLGFIAMAIPIAPSGLGVGHAIFGTLFSFFGIQKGASLFNLYFLCVVFCNLTGCIPYILTGKKYSEQQLEQVSTV